MSRLSTRSLLLGGVLLATSLAVGSAAPALAQGDSPEAALESIREMALYARYREALEGTQAYLERADLDAAQRNAGLELLATVHIAMRNQEAAQEVLAQLYARDPGHRLSDPDASPPVLSAFGRARSNPPPPQAVTLDHEPPTLTDRRPPRIEVTLGEGAEALAELRLRYRRADETRFNTVVMNRGDGVASARIPLVNEEEAYDVVYYVEGLAPSGAQLVRIGSPDEPLSFTVPAAEVAIVPTTGVTVGEDETSETPSGGGLWWVGLVAGGVVLVGAAIALGVLLSKDDGPDDGSLGNVQLPLVSF